MARFGSFEVVRELSSAQGAIVYLVREPGAAQEFVVKHFSGAASATGDTSVWRRGDFAEPAPQATYASTAEFTAAAQRQKQAADGPTDNIAPILETGEDDQGAWYRTLYYKNNLKRVIGVHLKPEIFHSGILSIAQAALAFKQRTGAAHGNLKPANVFIVREEGGRSSRTVISDPLPLRGRADAKYEIEDLRAIGEIIYQIIRRKEVSARENWPLPPGPEWGQWFGKQADHWRELCDRLLDPHLGPGGYTLEQLERELVELKPKPPVSRPVLIAAAAVVIAAIVAAVLIIPKLKPAEFARLQITTDPEGAEVLIDDQNPKGWKTPLEEDDLSPGNITIKLQHPDLNYEPYVTNVNLAAGKLVALKIPLKLYGGFVELKSDLPGVRCYYGEDYIGLAYPTGAVSIKPLPVGQRQISAKSTDHPFLKTITTDVLVVRDEPRVANFEFPRGGIILTSSPPGATVSLKGIGVVGKTPYQNLHLNPGPLVFTLDHSIYNQAEVPVVVVQNVTKEDGRPLRQGEGTVVFQVSPREVELECKGERKVIPASGSLEWKLPAGGHTVMVRHKTLTAASFPVEVQRDTTTNVQWTLPHATLHVKSTPADAEIFRNGQLFGRTGADILVDPGPGSYEVKKGEESETFQLVAEAGQPYTRELKLSAGSGDIELVSNLPGASIFKADGTLVTNMPMQGDLRVRLSRWPRARHEFVARYPHLDDVSNSVTVSKDGSVTLTNSFLYGSVSIQMPAEVHLAGMDANRFRKTPDGVFFPIVKPGTLELRWDSEYYLPNLVPISVNTGANSTNLAGVMTLGHGTVILTNTTKAASAKVFIDNAATDRDLPFTTNLPARTQRYELVASHKGVRLTNHVVVKRNRSTNSFFEFEPEPGNLTNYLGMELVWVRMPGIIGKAGCWVSKHEVTFPQLTNVLGTNTFLELVSGTNAFRLHRNRFLARNYSKEDWPASAPADSVSTNKADLFCTLMNARKDANIPPDSEYVVPAWEQYRHLIVSGAATNHAWSVSADWGTSAKGWTKYDDMQPMRVGARGADDNGLCDLNGNLLEWVRFKGRLKRAGTVYCGPVKDTLKAIEDDMSLDESAARCAVAGTGLRVLLVPRGSLLASGAASEGR